MDLFEPSSGSQVHDNNAGILLSGLFWTVELPNGALHFSRDGRRAMVHAKDVPVIDTFQFASPFNVPATVSFRVEWEAIAGESLARHATASRVDGDTLIVEAGNSYVMFELSHRKAELLERLAAHLGEGTIRDVRLVLGRNQEARP